MAAEGNLIDFFNKRSQFMFNKWIVDLTTESLNRNKVVVLQRRI